MPTNLHILSMLIQNADRTTYGINKIVVFVLAFVVFLRCRICVLAMGWGRSGTVASADAGADAADDVSAAVCVL